MFCMPVGATSHSEGFIERETDKNRWGIEKKYFYFVANIIVSPTQ